MACNQLKQVLSYICIGCSRRCRSVRAYLSLAFRGAAALVALMAIGLYTMTALGLISQLAYSYIGSDDPNTDTALTGFALVFACFLITEVTVLMIDLIAVYVLHVAFMVSLIMRWREYFDWASIGTIHSSTNQPTHASSRSTRVIQASGKLLMSPDVKMSVNPSGRGFRAQSGPDTAVELTSNADPSPLQSPHRSSLNIEIGEPVKNNDVVVTADKLSVLHPEANLEVKKRRRYDQASKFIAADFAQQVVDALLIAVIVLSALYGAIAILPNTPQGSKNSSKPPTLLELFQSRLSSAAVTSIAVTTAAMYVGVFLVVVARGLIACVFSLLYVVRTFSAFRARFKHWETYVAFSLYLVFWPLVLVFFTTMNILLRLCPCRTFEGVRAWCASSYALLPVPQWAHDRDTYTDLAKQSALKVMWHIVTGAGVSTYESMRFRLRNFTGWYIIAWFIGALAHGGMSPAAISGLGIIGGIGIAAVCARKCSKRSERHRAVQKEATKLGIAEVEQKSGDGCGLLRDMQVKESSFAAPRNADTDVDATCAWGTCMFVLTMAATWASFSLSPSTGVFMLLLLLLLSFNWCMPAPRMTMCSTVCRLVIVIVAAVYGAFTSSYRNDSGKLVLLTSFNGTVVQTPNVNSYAVCQQSWAGLSTVDYCMLSALAYSDPSYLRQDMQLWFAKAGMNMTEEQVTQLPSGLRYFVYRRNDTVANKSYLYVSIRGSRAERDFTQDLFLWQEALLLQTLGLFGPYNSFPISVQQQFIKTIADVSHLVRTADYDSYVMDLEEAIEELQSSYPNDTIVLTGHSLGGGLASFMTQQFGLPSISISGPGTVLTGPKLGISEGSPVYGGHVVIVPDFDIVPRVDLHVGTVQNINCLGSVSAADCHSCTRSCCELIRSCGDPYGRTLQPCAGY